MLEREPDEAADERRVERQRVDGLDSSTHDRPVGTGDEHGG
ncbi:hypothetical protein ACFQHN_17075 [Natrialbaceae archaeon GCM10025896]